MRVRMVLYMTAEKLHRMEKLVRLRAKMNGRISCPGCGTRQVQIMYWSLDDSWKYRCRMCQNKFIIPLESILKKEKKELALF